MTAAARSPHRRSLMNKNNVPAGFVLVPRVATTAQRLAMAKADDETGDRYRLMAAALIAEAPVAQPPATGEAVAEIVGTEKRGFALMPVVRWEPGFARNKVGTKLYATPPVQQTEAAGEASESADEQRCEKLRALGWQAIVCGVCGHDGAVAYPRAALTPPAPALPPVARVPLTDVTRFDQRVIDLQEKAFMPYAQALELAASEFGDILCWVHEWGAIGLPLGHPSRVTCFAAFNTLAEAVENAVACEFNDRILPVFQPTESDLNEYPASRRTFIQSDAARPVGEVVIGPKGDVEGWTVVRWGDDGCPPIGTKLYTHGIEASTGEQSHG